MESAFWFHIVNVILHILSSILFTRICSNVAGFKRNFSLIAGIFFAVHPIHTESKFTSHKQSSPTPHSSRFFFFSSPLVRCIRNCRTGGTLRMFFILAFVSFVSWVRFLLPCQQYLYLTFCFAVTTRRSHRQRSFGFPSFWAVWQCSQKKIVSRSSLLTSFTISTAIGRLSKRRSRTFGGRKTATSSRPGCSAS